MRKNGISPQRFISLASKSSGKTPKNQTDLLKPENVELVIRDGFDGKGDYYEWLNAEVNSGSIQKIDRMIAEKNEVIGDVIPSYAEKAPNPDPGFEQNQITVATFIEYVEEKILKRFRIASYSPIGIENVGFDNSQNTIINIGTFEFPIEFEGSNSQISELLDFVQNSGKITIENGRLVSAPKKNVPPGTDSKLSDLSNLLITIKDFAVDKPLSDPNAKNRANMTLVFYVKGRNYSSFIDMRKQIVEYVKNLKAQIEKTAGECKNTSEAKCRSDASIASIGAIRNLVSEVSALDKQAQEYVKNTNVSNLGTEFEKIFSLYASAKTIESAYQKHKAVFDRAASVSGQKK